MTQFDLLRSVESGSEVDWTFRNFDTRYFTHCYHDYPARMIPQIADRLLALYGKGARLLFDPYCGSGTTLVEATLHGMDSVGTDINPLARLISVTKTSYIEPKLLDHWIREFLEFSAEGKPSHTELPPWLDKSRIEFWFKPEATRDLLAIYSFIQEIKQRDVHLFFLIAFSETIRETSNTRSDEFKLFRKSASKLSEFCPDAFRVMVNKLGRNRQGYADFLGFMGSKSSWPNSRVCEFNTIDGIPSDIFEPNSVDIVVTSPPYGDSHTTVAYGQYSRLSSEWLAFVEAPRVDRMLMGGRVRKNPARFGCFALNDAIDEIRGVDSDRADEVASFYHDLEGSIKHVADVVRSGGHVCYVVANRKVKGVVIPTDEAVIDFFQDFGFSHITTHHRHIPNKRMPSKNSPSNVAGENDTTMVREIIVVLRKD